MTPEKLAELEKLEAAATPGEWSYECYGYGVRAWWRGKHRTEIARSELITDYLLANELRNNATGLFAALREAWRERDEALLRLSDAADCEEHLRDTLKEVNKERDEARKVAGAAIKAGGEIIRERDEAQAALAESERWRNHWETLDALAAQKAIDRRNDERDEARAEAARLREYLETEVGTTCDATLPKDVCGVTYPMKTYCCIYCRTRLFLEGKEP